MPEKEKVLALIVAAFFAAGPLLGAFTYKSLLLNGDEEEGEGENGGEGDSELAEWLGSTAWNLGIPLILGFVVYKHAYIWMIKRKMKPPLSLKTALEIHALTSIALGAMALAHGALLLEYAGLVEWIAAGLVALVTVSGFVLYYVSSRRLKNAARLVHAQRIIGIAVLIAVWLHTVTIDID